MICDKCKNMVCLSALSVGVCKICDKETPTPHIPSYSICKECSTKNIMCEQCGKNLVHEE